MDFLNFDAIAYLPHDKAGEEGLLGRRGHIMLFLHNRTNRALVEQPRRCSAEGVQVGLIFAPRLSEGDEGIKIELFVVVDVTESEGAGWNHLAQFCEMISESRAVERSVSSGEVKHNPPLCNIQEQ